MERNEESLEKLVAGLKEAYGDDLESVILYGSAASQEYHHKHSDLNVLVVVRNSRFHKISRASRIARWWNKTGNPPPLFFTEREMAEAADVFPIEFSDMKDCHKILFGKDTLSELAIDHKHQRLECEHELRGKLLNLRSRYVLVAGDVRESTHLLAQSISSFATLFRHALHLAGKPTPLKKVEIFEMAAREFQFDAAPFLEVLAVRRGEKKLAKEEIDPLFGKYVDAIERVTERVDGMAS